MEPIKGPHSRPFWKTRADGWPLCPECGEDELWSSFAWDGSDPKPPMQAWIDHGLRCYRCNWSSTESPAATRSSGAFVDAINESHARLMAFCHQGFVMETPDHYPLQHLPQCARCGEHEPPGTLHICADVVARLNTGGSTGITAAPAAIAPVVPPNRFVKRGDSMVCLTCNLDARYCRGHAPPSPPSDGIDSDLNRRIREARGRDSR